MAFLEQYKDLKIQLEDIKSATNNFGKDKLIGCGGFGPVYKGEMSRFKEQGLVAFKRLDGKLGQGAAEFSKEIMTLSRYTHENLISLLGFCDEGGEKILVYEYASNGSLDRHLSCATTLTWRQRLKICLQAARALEYLHDPRGTNQRVIHCDIKSGNILLDDELNAKLSDLGLSKMCPANQAQSFLISSAVGTLGYCDPLYLVKGFLTKESDVYSFGVLLFEVLCGKSCCKTFNDRFELLVPTWKETYEQNRVLEMVFEDLVKQDMDYHALKIFSDIAYRCLKTSREERPTITEVVTELEIALESQKISEGKEELIDYEEMSRTAKPPLNYRCKAELKMLLSKGVLLNEGKTWFSLNKNGEHCEMISIAACLQTKIRRYRWSSYRNSRFAVGTYRLTGDFEAHVRPQFLSPFIIYTVNLVFRFDSLEPKYILEDTRLEYKLEGETETSVAYLPVQREDGLWMIELYQFDSEQSIVNLEILFGGLRIKGISIEVEGIEFQPLEIVEHKVLKDGKDLVSEDENGGGQSIPDSDASWEDKLPPDYEDIIKWSKDNLKWTTKKKLYSILCNGFLVNDGLEWFSLDKNGKKCLMLSVKSVLASQDEVICLSLPESRFGAGYELSTVEFQIKSTFKSQVLSSETRYATYLVYKLPQDQSKFKAPLLAKKGDYGLEPEPYWFVHLVGPQTPIIRPKAEQKTTHNPLNRPNIKCLPQQRSDGWMEVQIWELKTGRTAPEIYMHLHFQHFLSKMISGLIVQGVEFRPI